MNQNWRGALARRLLLLLAACGLIGLITGQYAWALAIGLGALAVLGAAAFVNRGRLGRTARPLLAGAARQVVARAAARRPLAAAKLALKHPRQAARLASALR